MTPGLAVSRPEVSVLLSPSAFQQSISKTTASVVPSAPSEPPSTSAGAAELTQAPCSKTQLQETLIHLIKVQQGRQRSTGMLVKLNFSFSTLLCKVFKGTESLESFGWRIQELRCFPL